MLEWCNGLTVMLSVPLSVQDGPCFLTIYCLQASARFVPNLVSSSVFQHHKTYKTQGAQR